MMIQKIAVRCPFCDHEHISNSVKGFVIHIITHHLYDETSTKDNHVIQGGKMENVDRKNLKRQSSEKVE